MLAVSTPTALPARSITGALTITTLRSDIRLKKGWDMNPRRVAIGRLK